MQKLKVMSVVGTRPELIRLSRVLNRLDTFCDHCFVHTGQNFDYELSQIFFDDLKLRKPDHFLNCADRTNSSSDTVANVIRSVDKVLEQVKPDAILVLGDTNSCLSVIPAKKRQIPIFHMEAGNRCFDFRVPEETNRRIVDHVADINLTYSDIAREYLISEGISADQVIKTGSPMFEVLDHFKNEISSSQVLDDFNLESEKYFVVSAHREENVDFDRNFNKLIHCLNSLAEQFLLPIIVSTHPRTRARVDSKNIKFHSLVTLMKPLGFFDYVKLQTQAKAVLSDSGTITEESSILNFPAINIREAHERPEGMEEASVIMTGLNFTRILQALKILEEQNRAKDRSLSLVADYATANVSEKVVRIIHSYTDYINQKVWKKPL